MQALRIAEITAFFPPLTTGSSHFSADITNYLGSNGHIVKIFTCKLKGSEGPGSPRDSTIDEIPAKWISLGALSFNYAIPSISLPNTVRRLYKDLDQFDPDIVHINGHFFDIGLWAARWAKQRSVPCVVTIHTPLLHVNRIANKVLSLVDKHILARLLKGPKVKFVAVEGFTLRMYSERYKISGDMISFIPATSQMDVPKASRQLDVVDKYQLQGKKVILSFGHVIPIRSRKPLVRALPRVLTEFPDLQLLIVGEVYDRSFISLAEQLGVAHKISIVGRVPRDEVMSFFEVADVECHDLEDGHGLGMTSLEAMAAGVPIVAVIPTDSLPGIDLTDFSQMQISSVAGQETLAASLVRILRLSEADRAVLIEQQRNFVQLHFSVTSVGDRYIEMFLALAQSN